MTARFPHTLTRRALGASALAGAAVAAVPATAHAKGRAPGREAVSYTHLTLPTILRSCRSRWSPYH